MMGNSTIFTIKLIVENNDKSIVGFVGSGFEGKFQVVLAEIASIRWEVTKATGTTWHEEFSQAKCWSETGREQSTRLQWLQIRTQQYWCWGTSTQGHQQTVEAYLNGLGRVPRLSYNLICFQNTCLATSVIGSHCTFPVGVCSGFLWYGWSGHRSDRPARVERERDIPSRTCR